MLEEDVHVVITNESKPSFKEEYLFKANQLQDKKSIHFKWNGKKVRWEADIKISFTTTSNTRFVNQESENISKRDKYYIIDL